MNNLDSRKITNRQKKPSKQIRKLTSRKYQVSSSSHSPVPVTVGWGLQNTPTASLQKGKAPPMSVLYVTLNNLMVKFR